MKITKQVDTPNLDAVEKQAPVGQSKMPPALNLNTPAEEDPWAPTVGQKKTSLDGTYGKFEVEHGLTKAPTTTASGKYTIQIDMTPNKKTEGSNIRFVQSVRRGTTPGNWSVKATDSGMNEDRAKRAAEGGWRIDRADPGTDKTPFYGHKKAADGSLSNLSNSKPGKFDGDKPMLWDAPGVLDPSVLEFSANAMDDRTGVSFGSVGWGFQYDSSKKTYTEETPRLLADGDERLAAQEKATKKWNEVYGKGGTVDESVSDVLVPKGKTNCADVNLVSDWEKPDAASLAKLDKDTEVNTLSLNTAGTWRKVEVLAGTNKGKSGWISNSQFVQAY